MRNKRRLIIASAAIFVITAAISTITAARVDQGSMINLSPADGGSHTMSLGEAVLHNLPPAIIEGMAVAALFIAGVMIVRKFYEMKSC